MLLSRSCTYGLQVMAYLAMQGGRYVTVEELGTHTEGSPAFIAKIVQKLHRAGLVETRRGPHGGLRLARHPASIPLVEVIRVLDQPERWETCILGFQRCSPIRPCAVHASWAPVKEDIKRFFMQKTVADLTPYPLTQTPDAL